MGVASRSDRALIDPGFAADWLSARTAQSSTALGTGCVTATVVGSSFVAITLISISKNASSSLFIRAKFYVSQLQQPSDHPINSDRLQHLNIRLKLSKVLCKKRKQNKPMSTDRIQNPPASPPPPIRPTNTTPNPVQILQADPSC